MYHQAQKKPAVGSRRDRLYVTWSHCRPRPIIVARPARRPRIAGPISSVPRSRECPPAWARGLAPIQVDRSPTKIQSTHPNQGESTQLTRNRVSRSPTAVEALHRYPPRLPFSPASTGNAPCCHRHRRSSPFSPNQHQGESAHPVRAANVQLPHRNVPVRAMALSHPQCLG